MLGNIGWSGLVLILIALLLVFGPSKLPEIGKAFGRSLREFRNATKEMTDDVAGAVRGHSNDPSSPSPGTASSGTAAATVEPIVLQEGTPEETRPSQAE
ncbi:twin-arginine translocase TatA/TatE family subunit [Alicyclobacillus cycloheptanicus]|jgi:sec-independent protein translocase protein TatA|uniref:Sec-independent protein translocase protein TatA n=1 Tax=Alicyclobacillus cycloheptanicus TaxID=1457 RepID=A0ABT9XIB1_9BACL|nr:sec-independent protein translocase protein TatA [Alicyclobacillus cycloheptanicus]WDM02032.1 twin-arginine translocase TatA/TatE family subunit [Alicyclobacillus cycloheptanicus]